MAVVKFITGTLEQYKALSVKDSNALYFLTNGQLFKGETNLSDSVEVVTAYPSSGEVGKIYINTTDDSVKYCSSSGFIPMVPSVVTTLSGAGNDNSIPTTKAVIDYVTKKIGEIPAAIDYTVTVATKDLPTEGYAKTYQISQLGKVIGTIDIPKDMVVSSGTVKTNSTGVKVIELVLNNGNTIEIPVADLVDVYTAQKAATQVQLAISKGNEISATIVAGSVTKTELASSIVTSLGKADTAVQKVTAGSTNGTISVDGKSVAITGLKSAAYKDASDFDTAGAANTALTNAKSYTDTALTNAKSYTDTALTWTSL